MPFFPQPETHFFLANMLAAKGNFTGSKYHYKEALHQNPNHQQAFNMLRMLKVSYTESIKNMIYFYKISMSAGAQS